MKRIGLFLCIIVALIACEDDDKVETIINTPPVVVDNGPIDFSSNPISFSPTKTSSQKVVLVSNDTTPLQYSVIDQPDWVILGQTNGVIYDLHDFYVNIDQNRNYPFGILKDSIEFFTRVGRSYLEVRYVNGDGDRILHEDTVVIGALGDTASLHLFNNTLNAIDVSLNAPTEIITDPQSFNIGSGLNQSVLLTANRNAIPDSTVFFTLVLSHGSTNKNITIKVESFNEDKLILNGNVVDAEYDPLGKQLYYVTSSPASLVQFNPSTQQFNTLSLNQVPYCISLSKSGNYAAIGNDGTASLINLQSMSLISNFNTGARAADIILKDSAFAYILPRFGQHIRMRCVNLQNNNSVSDHSGWTIYQNARGKLHPSQQAIYTVDNDVSPKDVDKFGVAGGIASYLYDSPYHGDYNFGGNLWFSNDGNRIFTKGKSVLIATNTSTTDMTYNGSIQLNIPNSIKGNRSDWEFEIRHLHNHKLNGNMVIVAEDYSPNSYDKVINQVYIHQSSNLQFMKRIVTEDFGVPDYQLNRYDYFPAEAFFAFYTGHNDEIVVITKATNSGLSQPWAIELVNQ